ncbi:uncharacterized protein DS421_10g309030 [Arachis hypogaea]|nr:uncharacterized protein DS421_10g309030 [Arachis hypogaea]
MKLPLHQNPYAAKATKFVMPEDEEDFTNDELDDEFNEDDEDYDNGKFDDDMDALPPPNKMKKPAGPIDKPHLFRRQRLDQGNEEKACKVGELMKK